MNNAFPNTDGTLKPVSLLAQAANVAGASRLIGRGANVFAFQAATAILSRAKWLDTTTLQTTLAALRTVVLHISGRGRG